MVVEHEPGVCRSCGAVLPAPKAGQRQLYCSTACRRMAEYAIKRITLRLQALETRLSEIRLGRHGNAWLFAVEDNEKAAIAAFEAEIALQNARLRELLAE